ncbi:hypothetical protein LOD99_4851 [Oopsacas minuta]|uniref:Ubiquitin-like domain-containing protein n=1 Tax=Oopsacas minuta TaxID=111878 RepID=A0AAV7JS25_9METZ|nr:hypothetical protein LOD99_4851 [Oopsacas minuta]
MPSLKIQTMNGKIIHIEVDQGDTILNVKNKIEEKIGVDALKQILSCNGDLLENREKLEDKMDILCHFPINLMVKANISEDRPNKTQPIITGKPEKKGSTLKKCCNIL